MVLVLLGALAISSGLLWDNSYKICKEIEFKSAKCELQKKAEDSKKHRK